MNNSSESYEIWKIGFTSFWVGYILIAFGLLGIVLSFIFVWYDLFRLTLIIMNTSIICMLWGVLIVK